MNEEIKDYLTIRGKTLFSACEKIWNSKNHITTGVRSWDEIENLSCELMGIDLYAELKSSDREAIRYSLSSLINTPNKTKAQFFNESFRSYEIFHES